LDSVGAAPNVSLREATKSDSVAIAHLHAESWRSAYRGMLSDDYLDNRAHADRAAIWESRSAEIARKPFFAIVAEAGAQLAGFACVFPQDHPTFGSFLDNLHVAPQSKGQGIGRRLLDGVARHLIAERTPGGLYLWVIDRNTRARQFYAKAGAAEVERAELPMPDDSRLTEVRCFSPDPATLLP
jgi:GNAT superfamily N-acetyltransferase